MRPDPRAEGARWLSQAERDLDDARFLTAHGRHHLACFLAQQSAEKALKAALYASGETTVLGHSAAELAKRAAQRDPRFESVAHPSTSLDKFYIPTRYPNAMPGGIPSEAYDAGDAERAIGDAETVLTRVREALGT